MKPLLALDCSSMRSVQQREPRHHRHAHDPELADDEAAKPFAAFTPVQRLGQRADVGDVAVWLSTQEARFITGQSILVDGGYTIGGMR